MAATAAARAKRPGPAGSAGSAGRDIGIWHETFLVRDGEYEAVYGNMPPKGLAKASKLVPVAESSGARQRLKNAVRD